MLPAKYHPALLASIGMVLLLTLSAYGFALAYNGTSASQLVPTSEPAPTPDIPATVEALVQARLAEILSADTQALADAAQFTDLARRENGSGDYYRSGFACTGSMRPTIDCGDEGVFLKPPFAEPLIVGDIISFSSDVSCRYYKDQDISKAHRIISIRENDGRIFYSTQGDAVEEADPCETTISQIDGKLVEIHKGVRPQDIIDTAEYDLAKKNVTALKGQYDELLVEFEQGKTAYDSRGQEYQRLVSSYTKGNAEYEVVTEFYQQLEAERVALNQRKDRLNDLAREINTRIGEVDLVYRELFIQ